MTKKWFYLFTLLILASTQHSLAQKHQKYIKYRDSIVKGVDPNYILSYGNAFVARVYAGKSMNHFNVYGKNGQKDLDYAANFPPNYGFGFSYRFLTLNLTYGIGSPSPNKGNTKSLNLQSNLYYRKWAFDVMIKSMKGMYLKDENAVPGIDGHYINPNLRSTIIGASGWRILNPKRFSYRAVMTQNEWQKKSAGTLLLGAEAYYGFVHGHDSIVPAGVIGSYPEAGVSNLSYVKIGPGVGYAYNYIFRRNFFVSASLTANMDLSFNKEVKMSVSHSQFAFQPNYNFRIGAGYNSKDWNINFQYLNNNYPIKGNSDDSRYKQFAGNYRLSFNRRLYLSRKTRKLIAPIDQSLNKIDSVTNSITDPNSNKGKK